MGRSVAAGHRVLDGRRCARRRVLDSCRRALGSRHRALGRLRHLLSSLGTRTDGVSKHGHAVTHLLCGDKRGTSHSYLLNGAGGAVLLQLRAVGSGSGGVAHGAGGGAGGALDALRRALHSTPG